MGPFVTIGQHYGQDSQGRHTNLKCSFYGQDDNHWHWSLLEAVLEQPLNRSAFLVLRISADLGEGVTLPFIPFPPFYLEFTTILLYTIGP